MNKIIILSKNAGMVSKDECAQLASCLHEKLNVKVEFSTPKHLGTQVTFNDVLEIWLILDRASKTPLGKKIKEKVADKIIDEILDQFADWAIKRMKGETKKRPKTLTIFDDDSNVIKSITVKENDEIVDETERDRVPRPPEESEPF